MENEMKNLVMVWLKAIACLWYCYILGSVIPKRIKRLIFIVPVICIFLHLPLHLSTMILCGFTSFFVVWLANFKLLLFAFGKGPLCSHPPLSLPRFIAVASLPINIQKKTLNSKSQDKPLNYAIKALIAAVLIQSKYYLFIHPLLMYFLNYVQIYIFLELGLAVVTGLAQFLIGLPLEPTFDEPFLTTSLQDFWSQRWNLMVPNILKPTVYEPIRGLAMNVVGRKLASTLGILGSYLVSGLMHELEFYYLGHEKPTWELTLFFMIDGFGVAAEVVWKKTIDGKWKLPPVVSWCLTMGFIAAARFQWFTPAMHRCNAFERGNSEYNAFDNFIGNATTNVKSVM